MGSPPEQPKLAKEQSTNYYEDKTVIFPVLIWLNPSKEALVEKAQQDPQDPWFSTGATAPFEDQSKEEGTLTFLEGYSG